MQVPAMVGKYELLEFLGGGMSHVYRGRDTVIGRPVVVKLLTPECCGNAEAKARFLQEVKLAGNIQHDNIVSIFDFGEHDGRPFIVMEYLKGQDLRDAIRGGHTGSLMDRLKIALQAAEALEYVNAQGIVHRDIKPENIHIDAKGRVKLMDFGIAKTADLSLTNTGMVMGTPYYMAPEQVTGKKVTEQADVYAFGLLFYELLAGSRAVSGDSMEAVLYQILNQPLDPAPMVNAGVPPQVRALVLRCVEKDPANRPRGFREVVAELQGFIAGESSGSTRAIKTQPLPMPPPPAVAPQKPARSIAIWFVMGAVVIAIAAGAFWWTTRIKPQPIVPVVPLSNKTPPGVRGMVYIAAGTFLSGEANTPTQLGAFYIDETEVSSADFADFCRATGCSAPDAPPDLPVVRVTIVQARQFAAWKGKRLPTAEEWERAARGTDGKKYPWGAAEDGSLANVGGTALKPVKSYAPYGGVYQMAGNAWEMVEGNIKPSPGALATFASLKATSDELWIAIRGGAFNKPLAYAVAYESASIPERFSSEDIGFRCAKTP